MNFVEKIHYRIVTAVFRAEVRRCRRFEADPGECADMDLCQQGKGVDIITVAFNNPSLVAMQIRLIRKFITDPDFTHIVADNSNDSCSRGDIRRICAENGVAYVGVPEGCNRFGKRYPALSHGLALNFVFNRIIRARQPRYFAFLDHDIMPVARYGIAEHLDNQDVYGCMRDFGPWYLWPGFCFFRYERVRDMELDFAPCFEEDVYLDAGGSNYSVLYKDLDKNALSFPSTKAERVARTAGISDRNDVFHTDSIVRIDGGCWIHLVNGSMWSGHKEEKARMLDLMLKMLNDL